MIDLSSVIRNALREEDGIWYGPKGGYWSNLDKDEQRKYLRDLEILGSRETVKKYFPKFEDIVFSPKRAAGIGILNFTTNELVLDAGCMWGALTIPIARTGCQVLGIEQTSESLFFLKQRCKEENLANITLLCADLNKIDFKEDRFTKVIVNGVLEWLPQNGEIELKKYYGKRTVSDNLFIKYKESPKVIQLRFLKKVYQSLKKDGLLYVAIENRWNIAHFFGERDAHCALRFITILPRRVQDIISKIFLGRPYRNWIYGQRELVKLLQTAGFSRIKVYYAFPDYRFPEFILSKDDREFFKPTRYLISRTLIKKIYWWGIEQLFYKKLRFFALSPCFIVHATK